MNAALGGVSAGGFGSPESDVTYSGGGPNALVANQPAGNASGATLSKSSEKISPSQQRNGHGLGVAPSVEKYARLHA
jgi:hypothetical protein